MNWRGKELKTYPEIIDCALALEGENQRQFVDEYKKTGGPCALQNVGYFAGYYDTRTAERILEIFETKHPIFGAKMPSAKDAYEMGLAAGAKAKGTRA